jgi:hypothetical protein
MFVFKHEWLKKTVFAHQPFVPSDARKVNDVLSKHSVEPNKSKLIRTEMIKETQRNAKKRKETQDVKLVSLRTTARGRHEGGAAAPLQKPSSPPSVRNNNNGSFVSCSVPSCLSRAA